MALTPRYLSLLLLFKICGTRSMDEYASRRMDGVDAVYSLRCGGHNATVGQSHNLPVHALCKNKLLCFGFLGACHVVGGLSYC